MATSGAAELLRQREDPQRTTFLELFFDLVYVFALTRVSERLVEDFTSERRILLTEAGQTLLLLLTLLLVWSYTAWMTSRFDPQHPAIQLIVVGTMFGSLLMAVALPRAFGRQGLIFATTYVVVQVGRPLALALALRGHEAQREVLRPLFWCSVSAVPWITGALFPESPMRGALWTLALSIDYLLPLTGFPTPRLGRGRVGGPTISGEHLAERYQQFVIIGLGESILVTGFTFSGADFAVGRTVAFVVAFVTTVLLWRIYIYRAGALLAAAIAAAPRPTRIAASAAYTHLFIVTGIVATAVGYELVIGHPRGHMDKAWLAVILGGPALFVAGRARFEYVVFARVSRSRVIGLLALAAVAPLTAFGPPMVAGMVAAAVLAAIAISDAARTRGRAPELPSPPP